jgi:cyclohexadienyl dehydratase
MSEEVLRLTSKKESNKNEEIPSQVVDDHADVMITEITEAPWYVQNDLRLAAPTYQCAFHPR